MPSLAHHVDACLDALGSDDFARAYSDFVETLGAGQVMVFAMADDHARCLLSRHFSADYLAEELAGAYLGGWFRQDPLLPELRAAPNRSVSLRRFDDIARVMTDEYRRVFFDHPGLVSKTTVLAVGDRLRLFVSLYATAGAVECDPDLARLAGRLALMHFERLSESDIPEPLAVLSAREAAVCLGMLAGRKAEDIAAELGVAASTVVTYRKRAYAKLGITSRAGLFAICQK